NAFTALPGPWGTLAATPVPVDVMTNSQWGYVLAATDLTQGIVSVDTRIRVWPVDGNGNLWAPTDLVVDQYALPPAARQPGGLPNIDTLDARITQAVGDPNTSTGVWVQHTVGDGSGRAAVHWYQVAVMPYAGAPALEQQGAIANATDDVYNAAIAPRLDNDGA